MLDRSHFLSLLGASSAAALAFGPMRGVRAESSDTILVVVAQIGGCDFLNTVISLDQYGKYHDLRRPVEKPYDAMLPLVVGREALAATSFDRYAFHPAMHKMHQLYQEGRVGVLLGVGLPPQESSRLSHEAAKFDWHTGELNRLALGGEGWIAAGLPAASASRLPSMISTSTPLPSIFRSSRSRALAIAGTLENYALDVPALSDDDSAMRRQLVSAIQNIERNAPVEIRAQSSTAAVRETTGHVADIAQAFPASDYPNGDGGELDVQFKSVARLIASGQGVRAYFVSQGGYDTHSEQNRTHPGLLKAFSDSIARFYRYLQRKGLSKNVLIMSMTDFGRRATSDSSFGTDHGTASVNFVIGDRVRGGTYGEYPNLAKLDDDKNVAVPVDFRSQLATAAQHLQIELPASCLSYAAIRCMI